MNTFEGSLLAELRGYVAERSTQLAPEPARQRASRRWAWAAVPVGAAAVGAALLASAAPASAYTVQKAGNGDVVVTIKKLSDAAGLQRALRADGIDAYVSYDPKLPQPVPADGQLITQSNQGPDQGIQGTAPGSGDTGSSGPVGSCLPPAPLQVSVHQSAVTFDIAAADAKTKAKLYITTSGSAPSGPVGVQVHWLC